LKFETENDLFNESYQSLKYWDLVRTEVFYSIYYQVCGIKLSNPPQDIQNNSFSSSKKIFYILKYFYRIIGSKKKYLFLSASRNINKDGNAYDINLDDTFQILEKDSISIETFSKNPESAYGSVFNYGFNLELFFRKKVYKKFIKEQKVKFRISQILKKEFEVNIDFDQIISDCIEFYKVQFNHYTRLFKFLNLKAIFMVQNGNCKGIFSAANKLNIPIVEFQHGLIGYYHPLYSYPLSINCNHISSLPKYFFSYSSFWTESFNFPVFKKIAIGNSFISHKIKKKEVEFDLTILYSDGYNIELCKVIEDLIRLGYNEKICIKLHPSLFKQYGYIKEQFSQYDFIVVIKNETTVEELISISKSILTIQSTVVYQALNNNVIVYIYKRLDYQIHFDVFGHKKLILIDSADELISSLNNNDNENSNIAVENETNVFFNYFNKNQISDFLFSEIC
jgi:hypothetical protein